MRVAVLYADGRRLTAHGVTANRLQSFRSSDIRVSRIALGVRGSVLLGGASSSALLLLEGSRSDPSALLLCSFSPSSNPEVSE
jgi:hypothetical protein